MTTVQYSVSIFSILTLIFLPGCVVGPDYRTPVIETPPTWQGGLSGGLKNGANESVQLARWWQTLGDPLLSSLVDEAAANNLDLKLAAARLRESRARRGVTAADRMPTVMAGVGAGRNRSSAEMGTGASRTSDTFTAQFDASWELDLFGGRRRALEAASATLDASLENMRDVQVSLLAEVVLAYIEILSYQAQITSTGDTIASLADTEQIAGWRFQAGLVSQLDVEQARLNLEQTRAQLPTLHSQMEQSKNNLALLLGRVPGGVKELQVKMPLPLPPVVIAIGVPAETLRRRPDIRRAERQLAAATAQIGEAEAARYPDLTLSGTLGLQAVSLGNLLNPGALMYSLAANTAATIFDGGRLMQMVEIQNALQEQALISYQSAVQSALRDVENGLVAYAEEQNRYRMLKSAVQSAQNSEGLAQGQYAAGLIDFTTVLDTQRSLLSLQEQLILSEAAVISNLARLYKVLGGGWSNIDALTTPPLAAAGVKP
ncbi:MAG: efflux transporter outer membrane subunit [Deltaproteobacteria bacterium]|jgi:NodT family efflux transporter outer membrane factor (OMF) lipoprotein|nr:efflux transporter outer membrane subunit [Deltaproteobacteria bacterium]